MMLDTARASAADARPTATSALWPSLLPPSAHGRDDLCLVSAQGRRVTLLDGREVWCGTSGLWNVNLGYGNEAIAAAVDATMRRASYLGVFRYENPYVREAADRLVRFAGADDYERVLFSTSGGAANDLVMKLARQFHALGGEPGRKLVVGLRSGYHGLTFGSSALTHDDLGQQVHGVDRSLVRHVEVNDIDHVARLFDRQGSKIAAVIVEPLQGTGAVVLTPDYLAALGELCDRHGTLLVADEVATGFGRLGHGFASQSWHRRPDILVTSKALTNGTMAAAAVLASHRVSERFRVSDALVGHAETQAGTAVTASAVTATLDEFERLDAVAAGRVVAEHLDRELAVLARRDDVASVTGAGCFRAVRLVDTHGRQPDPARVSDLLAAIRAHGAIVHPGPGGFQLVPALTYTTDELDQLLGSVRAGLDDFAETSAGGATG